MIKKIIKTIKDNNIYIIYTLKKQLKEQEKILKGFSIKETAYIDKINVLKSKVRKLELENKDLMELLEEK